MDIFGCKGACVVEKVTVITSGKGGVGKSTVAAYLGVALCTAGKKVLLIDMDEGLRSLDIILNVSSRTVFDVTDVLNENCTPNEALLSIEKCNGLYLLPAPLKKGEIKNKADMVSLCEMYSDSFDYILIDSPAGIGDGFYLSAAAADSALLVVTPDQISVRDGAVVSELLKKNGIKNIRLVINKINTELMKKGVFLNIDEIINTTGCQLIGAVPTDFEIVRCSAEGRLLPESYAKDAFERLALRIMGKRVFLPKLQKFT